MNNYTPERKAEIERAAAMRLLSLGEFENAQQWLKKGIPDDWPLGPLAYACTEMPIGTLGKLLRAIDP